MEIKIKKRIKDLPEFERPREIRSYENLTKLNIVNDFEFFE